MAPFMLCDDCQSSLPSHDYIHDTEVSKNPSSTPHLQDKQSAEGHAADVQRAYLQYDEARQKAVLLVQRLELEMEAMKAYMAGVRSIHAPFRRLVPEVLLRIFTFAVVDADYSLRDLSSTPVVLGQVCSLWRELVCSSPHLWASIHVRRPVPGLNEAASRDGFSRAIQHHLLRSAARPLSLKVGHYADGEAVVEPLLLESHRWEDLTVENHAVFARLSDPTFNLSSLTTLCVPGVLRRALRLENATALRNYKGTRVNAFLPWAQLTSATLAVSSPRDCFQSMKRCQNAVSFTGEGLCCLRTDELLSVDDMLALPNLRELRLRSEDALVTRVRRVQDPPTLDLALQNELTGAAGLRRALARHPHLPHALVCQDQISRPEGAAGNFAVPRASVRRRRGGRSLPHQPGRQHAHPSRPLRARRYVHTPPSRPRIANEMEPELREADAPASSPLCRQFRRAVLADATTA